MKSFLVVSVMLVSLSAHADPYPKTLRLSNLPEGAQLVITRDLEMSESTDGADYLVYHYGFENGEAGSETDVIDLGSTLNSQVIIRTNVTNALERRSVSRAFYNSSAMFLKKGTYCLSRDQSNFDSSSTGYFGTSVDRMFFVDCSSSEPAFVVYAIAGMTLRRMDGYKGYTIGEFDFQTGRVIQFAK